MAENSSAQMESTASKQETQDEETSQSETMSKNVDSEEMKVDQDPPGEDKVADESKEQDNEKDAEEDETAGDEYMYTKTDQFTSEVFKICISNLYKKLGFAELKKKLTSMNLKPVKLKVLRNLCFVTFRCEADREKAIEVLNGYTWRGEVLKVQKAKPIADPLLMKRKQGQADQEASSEKKQKDNDDTPSISPAEQLKNAVSPLWNIPYEDQLKQKQEDIQGTLKKFGRVVEKSCADLRGWLRDQRGKYNGLCCELLDIVPSPVTSGYRNKCELTIGQGTDGSDVVGFRFGQYSKGSVFVGNPNEVSFLSEEMKTLIKVFQSYLTASQYRSFSPETHAGHWRQLTIRTSKLGHLMAMFDFHPQQLTEEELTTEKNSLKNFFSEGEGKSAGVTSLFFRTQTERAVGGSSGQPYELLSGDKNITETLLGLKFQISPDAFFQVNTVAAEILYKQISDWSSVSPNTTVLDICCGTGTIGQTVAKKVKTVIGIEMCSQAIEDAKKNAELNEIKNVTYHCSKAEDAMHIITRSLWSSEVVAIVDPPRGGLHTSVIVALRNCASISRLVYVSCNPTGASNNFLDLVRPTSKRLKGPRFLPVQAIPVDLFPDTKHCELVVQFVRSTEV